MDYDQRSSSKSSSHHSDAPQSQQVLKAGDRYGDFRVVRCVSSGLLARYYHMERIVDSEEVLVALLHPRASRDATLFGRLEALKQQVNRLEHPGIPKIRACIRIEGAYCLVYSLVEGQSLSTYFAENRPNAESGISAEQVALVCASLFGALGVAHAMGLNHLSLDSETILIREDGGLSLLGVGLKAALGNTVFESIISASVSPIHPRERLDCLALLDVLSPEYQSGQQEDSRVDVYAVGVIAYWLLTGHKPNRTGFKKPSTVIGGLSAGWDGFFTKLLERNQEARYQTCRGALRGLQSVDGEVSSDHSNLVQRQIDRIPVPKGVAVRGDLVTRVFRLSVIGLIGVLLTALMAAFVDQVFIKTTNAQGAIAAVASKVEANVELRLSPPEAEVNLLGDDKRFSAQGGVLHLSLANGEHQLQIRAPGYSSQTLGVRIDRGDSSILRQIQLKPRYVNVSVFTEAEAEVSLLGQDGVEELLGRANADGQLILPKVNFQGRYTVLVRKPEYSTLVVNDVEFSRGDSVALSAPLEPLLVDVLVVSEPEGASVFLEGQPLGETPLTIPSLEIGKQYEVVLRKEGYRAVTRHFSIGDDKQALLDVGELVRGVGSIDLAVEFVGASEAHTEELLADLVLELNGTKTVGRAGILGGLDEGDYHLRASHPLYHADDLHFSVRDNKLTSVGLRMSPFPGTISLHLPKVDPSEIKLFVNDGPVQQGETELSLPANESVIIRLEVKNFLTMRRQVTLEPNEFRDWHVRLVPIPGPTRGVDWSVPYLNMRFKWIDSGSFHQGSPLGERGRMPNEGPRTKVTFTRGFWVAAFETTQAQFSEMVGQEPSAMRGATLPVESITWQQAMDFCERLTKQESLNGRLPEGYVYRLPTEAEWEYFARGKTKTAYHFGAKLRDAVGNFRSGFGQSTDGVDQYGTLPVGSFEPNAYGLYDIHGNVAEWSLEWYAARLQGGRLIDPKPKAHGQRIAVRGGSWRDNELHVRSAARKEVGPANLSNEIGFRVVLAPSFQW